jgi:carboxyl-terminal processing protease
MTDRAHEPSPELPPPSATPPSRRDTVQWMVGLALAAVVGALLFAGGYLAAGGGGGTSGCAAPDPAFDAFCEAYDLIQSDHVDDVDPADLAEGAIEGMFQYGVRDPYSGYMPPEQYERALGDLSGTFSGIGAEMAIRNVADPQDLESCTEFSETCRFVVMSPLDDSPAERAGVVAGDVVLAVDGTSVDGSTMEDQISRIRGEAGTQVTLTLQRDDGEPFDVTITREEIELREVETSMIDGHIGYIALNAFSAPASEQFRDGLRELLDEGADQIVFDLRDNPGGYIDAAQQIASQFIDSGLIFSQESADDGSREWSSTGDGVATDPDLPIVVLINAGSASASEIVAAALKESGRATVVGEPSFGKDTVQVWSRLQNNGGVRITISRWFTPEHNSVGGVGVLPDIEAAPTAETRPGEDPVLDAALAFLAEQPVAAGTSAAPLDTAVPAGAWSVVGIVGTRAIC